MGASGRKVARGIALPAARSASCTCGFGGHVQFSTRINTYHLFSPLLQGQVRLRRQSLTDGILVREAEQGCEDDEFREMVRPWIGPQG